MKISAAGFLFQDANEFAVGGKVFIVPENGRRQMAVERIRGAHIIFRAITVHQQRVGSEDFIGELGLADKLIEADREQLGLRLECRGFRRRDADAPLQ